MMMQDKITEMVEVLTRQLKAKQSPDGMWRGRLSSSAISTAVSVFALHMVDREQHIAYIENGASWLCETMLPDGSWGDTVDSKANMTATLLSYAALFAVDTPPAKAKEYLTQKFGGISDQQIIDGVLAYYGKDLTFSAPILVMCALAGVIQSWKNIPQLPFELSVVPQRFFRFLQLPVVSYAIPALIAVGILRHKKGNKNLLYRIRESLINKSLKVLVKLQPHHGGFLEAAPLTAFVTMCMTGAGYKEHISVQRAVAFLTDTVRQDGSWSIDTNLSCWVTALSVRALNEDIEDKKQLAELIKRNAFTYKHPFTGAKEGGWGWTDLPGSAPDADDTSGALVALHILLDGKSCKEVEKGIEWLLALQNNDGGIPTFCKGWGKLPFDRSSPDISAHSLLAFELWFPSLPAHLRQRCEKSIARLLCWMNKTQLADGSWIPLWFGDQDAKDERSPVYGTAVAVEHLNQSIHPLAKDLVLRGSAYLASAQNEDGGWGGARNVASKVTLTSRALSALCAYPDIYEKEIAAGVNFIYQQFQSKQLEKPEAIGLYFARLWYSEELYNITFALNALKNIQLQNLRNQII